MASSLDIAGEPIRPRLRSLYMALEIPRPSHPVLTLVAAMMLPLGGLAGVACAAPQDDIPAAAEELPPGVEQILPRGGIPAIFEPTFVSAEEAEIPDDAWVLGVEVEGEARAYSLNLLNHHEVVNDRIGERDFAAVW